MKLSTKLYISLVCLVIGIVLFLVQQNWIIFHWGVNNSYNQLPMIKKDQITRKTVNLYFLKNEKFNSEKSTILWDESNTTHNLKQVVLHWLTCNQEEKIVSPSTVFENVVISNTGQAYLSFNQSLLSKEWSIYKKWYLLESLFKTILTADIQITSVIFLVNQEAMDDDHIDFSQPLPVSGFIT